MFPGLINPDCITVLDPAALLRSAHACEQEMAENDASYASEMPFFPPVFTRMSEEMAFGGLMEDLLRLFADLPCRLAGKDFPRLLSALRYTPAEQEILLPYMEVPWLAQGAELARFDGIASTDGCQVVELNTTGGIGGLGFIEDYIAAFETSAPAMQLMAGGIDWRIMRPIDSLRALMIRRAHELGLPRNAGTPLRVALATLAHELHLASPCVRHLRSAGVEVEAVSVFDLDAQTGVVTLAGDRVDVVWACISFEAMFHDPDLWRKTQSLLSAAAEREVVYLVPPSASVLGNKTLLALLTSARDDGLFSAAERALIKRSIPWTAFVSAESADEITRRQAELILKPARGVGGLGILYGPKVSTRAWQLALNKIAASRVPYVAQALCTPAVATLPAGAFGAEEAPSVELVLGGILIGGQFAGNFVRGQRAGRFRPVNCHTGGRFAPACIIDNSKGYHHARWLS